MRCNKPRRIRSKRTQKKFEVMVCVSKNGRMVSRKGKSTKTKVIKFGDKRYSHFKQGKNTRKGHGDVKRRRNFKSRHKCHQKVDPFTPGFWSCKWSW